MPIYRVRALGADFEAGDEGCDYSSAEAAERAAVKAGIAIAADEIDQGKKSSIIEARIHRGEQTIGRYVIALSVEMLPLGGD